MFASKLYIKRFIQSVKKHNIFRQNFLKSLTSSELRSLMSIQLSSVCLNTAKHSALSHQSCPRHSSWLMAQQKLFSHHQQFCPSIQPPPDSSAVSVLRSGHGGADQADEAEDEQVQAGSRLGLQTGAGLPQGKITLDVCFTTLQSR